MAAPKGPELITKLFDEIINDITEKGMSAVKAFKGKMSASTFYDLLLKDPAKSYKYTRALESRSEFLADETIEISDGIGKDVIKLPDGREIVDRKVIERDRLKVDTRKWLLSKMYPKKYGDRIAVEADKPGKIDELQEEKLDLEIKSLKEKLGI